MIDNLIDKDTLIRFAQGFMEQSGLSIGLYDSEGTFMGGDDSFSGGDVMGAISRLGRSGVESVLDLSTMGTRVSAIGFKDSEGSLLALFMVSAPSRDTVLFDRHLSIIEFTVNAYLTERERALSLSLDNLSKEKEGVDLSKELLRNETITEILNRMESEEDFDKIVSEILTLSAEYLGLSNAFLIQFEKDGDGISLVSTWNDDISKNLGEKLVAMKRSELPFADGLSYTISTDSRLPDKFRDFMVSKEISAGVFLPIFLGEENVMYLGASMENSPRHWNLSEAGFLNDVRRVISSILSRLSAKNSLASSYAVVESVLENIGSGVMVLEPESGNVLYTNDRFRILFQDVSDCQRFERRIAQVSDDSKFIREYYVEKAKIYISAVLGDIRWVDDRNVRIATVFDITENKEFEKRLEKQANIDELTGIYNRNYFLKELGSHLSKSRGPGAYLCLNVNGFKEINVTAGNDSGDKLLASIAGFLLKLSGEYARVYRLGADEFAVMITDSKSLDPKEMTDSIIRRFNAPWQLAFKDCNLTVSIGVSLFPKDGNDVSSVLKAGDIALSNAREKGGNSVVFFESTMEKELRRKILLRSFLKDSVANDCNGMELVLKDREFEIGGEKFSGSLYELIWNAPEMGVKTDAEFMPVARAEIIGDKIVRHLCDLAFSEGRAKNDFGYPEYTTGIILEICDLIEYDMVSAINEAISETRINPDRVVLIVRGRVFGEDATKAEKLIKGLKGLGAHVAIGGVGDESPFEDDIFDAKVV